MARFHMSEEGILGEEDLMTLCAVVKLDDPVATAGAPVVVPHANLLPVDLVPGGGLGLGHALVIADQKVELC